MSARPAVSVDGRPHCLVTDPQGRPGPGLVVTWRRDRTGWSAWTVYVTEGVDPVVAQAWVPMLNGAAPTVRIRDGVCHPGPPLVLT